MSIDLVSQHKCLNQRHIFRGLFCLTSHTQSLPGWLHQGKDLFVLKFMSLTISFLVLKAKRCTSTQNKFILIEPLVLECLLRRNYSHICRGGWDLNCKSVFREKEKKIEKLDIKEFQINTCHHPV